MLASGVLLLLLFPFCHAETYLYITLHDSASNGNLKYTTSGKFQGNLLPNSNGLHDLRGMLQINSSSLWVINAYQGNSTIFEADPCTGAGESTVIANFPQFIHPYQMTLNPSTGFVYATAQDTNDVVVLNSRTGSAATFVNLGVSPRGIAFSSYANTLFVALQSYVVALNTDGTLLTKIAVDHPTALLVSGSTLFVSSDNHGSPAVLSFDVSTYSAGQKYKLPKKKGHPTGMAVIGNDLYVLNQDNKDCVMFHVSSGKYEGTVIKKMHARPELLVAVEC